MKVPIGLCWPITVLPFLPCLLFAVIFVLPQSVDAQTIFRPGSEFTEPYARIVGKDNEGNLYMTAFHSKRVFKITPDGTINLFLYLNQYNGLGPINLAIDNLGRAYITGISRTKVYRFFNSTIGSIVLSETGDGRGNQFNYGRGVAIDMEGKSYIASGNSKVFSISCEGSVTMLIDIEGSGNGNQFSSPQGLVVDSQKNVYVPGSNSLFKIAAGGKISQLLVRGLNQGHRYWSTFPGAITIDSRDNVYVTGIFSHNVLKISADGTISEIINSLGDGRGNTLSNPIGITVDINDNIYVLGGANKIFRIEPTGYIRTIYKETANDNNFTIEGADDIDINGGGSLFIGGFGDFELIQIDPAPPATFNGETLLLPIVEVDGKYYRVELTLLDETTLEFQVGATERLKTPATTLGVSVFSADLLRIPMITDGIKNYRVELTLQPGAIFKLYRGDELVSAN